MNRSTSRSLVVGISLCVLAYLPLTACAVSPDGTPAAAGNPSAAPAAQPEAPSSADHAAPGRTQPVEQLAGGGVRPDAVPPEFVITPNGYFHPSCLTEVHDGESVSESGDVVSPGGAARPIANCAHPLYDRSGNEIRNGQRGDPRKDPALHLPGIGHAWLADFNEVVSGVTWQAANFRVPSAPIHYGSNVVFFFNAIEPTSGAEIIQPVLQWNQSGYSNQWTIASWYVDRFNRGYYSTPVRVNPGDNIGGYMYPYGSGSWFIGMNRNGSYAAGLAITSPFTFNWVFGGAMEVYNVNSCQDLPSSGYEFFTSEVIYQNGVPITPRWNNAMATGVTPNCNVSPFSGTTTGGMTWIYY